MDDDLVLNLSIDDTSSSGKTAGNGRKGGRWTDRCAHLFIFYWYTAHSCLLRLKAKRVSKRKTRVGENYTADRSPQDDRPVKRPRKEQSQSHKPAPKPSATTSNDQPSKPRAPTQIISSLFSSNPKIEHASSSGSSFKTNTKPSNAPLNDSSSFTGLGLDPLIISHLSEKMSIQKPTSIQRSALPALLAAPTDPSSSRDVFIQSQTGSGKTLSFLLPIIQDLLPLSSLSYIDRSVGTLAIIIAPTRELAKQISDVLERLLTLRLRSKEDSDGTSTERLTRWLVSGLLTGGSTRTHEKARLRKGIPILVATPGRLLDHLQNTTSLDVGKCRWLVLDEADRLMELGFEETIKGIVQGLEGRRKLAVQAYKEGQNVESVGWDWERRRRTVLCSATMKEDVQKLAGLTLQNPLMVKATENDIPLPISATTGDGEKDAAVTSTEKFTPPSQLAQKYVVVPLKLRLVTLVALLRSLLSQNSTNKRGSKIIVFLSCTDSVDFHWRLLSSSTMEDEEAVGSSDDDSDEEENADSDGSTTNTKPSKRPSSSIGEKIEGKSPLLPEASIFRLHGSLPLATRLASLKGFSALPSSSPNSPTASILLCTSVASRGLDLPLVRAVVQYDLPTEGGATEYVHRVGRTARAGKGGEAWSIVAPSEAEWVKWVENRMQGSTEAGAADGKEKGAARIDGVKMEEVLRSGFGGKGAECEERATEVQLAFERWILRNKDVSSDCLSMLSYSLLNLPSCDV